MPIRALAIFHDFSTFASFACGLEILTFTNKKGKKNFFDDKIYDSKLTNDYLGAKNDSKLVISFSRTLSANKSLTFTEIVSLLTHTINLMSLRSAVFQLEPELSKDYDIWFRNK